MPSDNPWISCIVYFASLIRITQDSLTLDSNIAAEISGLIKAACADMIEHGILTEKVYNTDDALIRRAIGLYVKAGYGLDNPDSEKYYNSFEMLEQHLMLSNDYITGGEA